MQLKRTARGLTQHIIVEVTMLLNYGKAIVREHQKVTSVPVVVLLNK